jgi:hypothetical protein
MSELAKEENNMAVESVPTYGLLTINHAYNEGKLTFKEWMELSREWSLAMIEQYGSEQHKGRTA